jgi:ABC-type transport system involved in Fe-S cluster assembly fused permease/ATPase subunit
MKLLCSIGTILWGIILVSILVSLTLGIGYLALNISFIPTLIISVALVLLLIFAYSVGDISIKWIKRKIKH